MITYFGWKNRITLTLSRVLVFVYSFRKTEIQLSKMGLYILDICDFSLLGFSSSQHVYKNRGGERG